MQVYDTFRFQNQSATGFELNDVRNNSHIYDLVGLNDAGGVTGALTDNGLISYGNWGQGQTTDSNTSVSVYANDEFQFGKLRIDGGLRYENLDAQHQDGNTPNAADPAHNIVALVDPGKPIHQTADGTGPIIGYQSNGFQQLAQPGIAGIGNQNYVFTAAGGLQPVQTAGSTYNGTYSTRSSSRHKVAYTIGANYLIMPSLSVYGRYADGFQTQGTDPFADIKLYEGGVRYQGGHPHQRVAGAGCRVTTACWAAFPV